MEKVATVVPPNRGGLPVRLAGRAPRCSRSSPPAWTLGRVREGTGASQESSAVDLPPHIDTSNQPRPGPAHKRCARHRHLGRPTATGPSNPPVDIEESRNDPSAI